MAQIIPGNKFSDITVVINDNTEVQKTYAAEAGSLESVMVFYSPDGKETMKTIDGGLKQFIDIYGDGPMSVYGQPYFNAKTAAETGAYTLHCLRVCAANAAVAHAYIVAQYKVDDGNKMTVRFKKKVSSTPVTTISALPTAYVPTDSPDLDGFTEVLLFTAHSAGRGKAGNNKAFRLTNLSGKDAATAFKNYYFDVYTSDTSFALNGRYEASFYEDAYVGDTSAFVEDVLDDDETGSPKMSVIVNTTGLVALFNAYKTANPDTELTVETFDPFLGINKETQLAIENYTLDSVADDAIALNDPNGIALDGGSDGDLDVSIDASTRETALQTAYGKGLGGEADPNIKSKNRYPAHILFDANFNKSNKLLLVQLANTRKDSRVLLDEGLEITTKQSVLAYSNENLTAATTYLSLVDAYAGKVKDSYNGKPQKVTSTNALIRAFATLYVENDYAKHIPFAGNELGQLESYFLKGSIYPVFDDALDAKLMNELTVARINYAKVNPNQKIVRSSQYTRQSKESALSEENNVAVVLDIKRDTERLCASYDYDFANEGDIVRFNKDVDRVILSKYSDQQVTSITAEFSQNAWEKENSCLKLNIAVVNRRIIKHIIVEIDVNKEES